MYLCGYFVLSYVPNWEAICIVPIFGLVFGKIWVNASPRHDHIYVTPHCFTIKFEEAPSCFVLNAFLWLLCITKWFKREVILDNTKIWGHFWLKFGYFAPPGSPCIALPPTVMQLILKKYHHALSWMYICGCFALSNGPNKEVLWIIPIFLVIFGQNVGF